jgi:hypothetical protein
MSTQYDSGYASLLFASTVTANSLVIMSTTDNTAQVSATAGLAIGTLQNDVTSGDVGLIKLNRPSTFARLANACTAGDALYVGATGQVSTTGTVRLGVARNAQSANTVVEVFLV